MIPRVRIGTGPVHADGGRGDRITSEPEIQSVAAAVRGQAGATLGGLTRVRPSAGPMVAASEPAPGLSRGRVQPDPSEDADDGTLRGRLQWDGGDGTRSPVGT